MDQARSTISKIFNGEPRSYTRFNLTQNMEGDNSQVEMKLSSDMDEEVEGNGVGDHLNHTAGKPYDTKPKPGRTPKHICFIAAITLLIFIIGYLIGYLVHRRDVVVPLCQASALPFDDSVNQGTYERSAPPLMAWDSVRNLLTQRLSASNFEVAFNEFTSTSHQAGSPGDEDLANKVMKRFNEYGMYSWTDKHFVKVQDPPAAGYNRVSFKGNEVGRPSGYLSYSATGTVTGPLLYAYYGQANDFRLLQDKSINLQGKVILVRAGKISFAQKVANAAKLNASAVLIYPDPADYSIGDDTQLFGHVHLGSGDPYTPGFPSFNHTQFPPAQSSGLPSILAQTITGRMATTIMGQMGGPTVPGEWGGISKLGADTDEVTLEVNNVLTERKINNVFGVIKGYVDSDRYVVLGAQRDAWGPGFAKSTVGTSVLVELARSISDMVMNDGFKPRRSIVFASWSAGEYGNIGATEWLEGYLSSLNMKAFSYINLDGVVTGLNGFKASASPMMYALIESTLKEVKNHNDMSIYSQVSRTNWESVVMEPLKMDDPAYPFLTFSGIPSVSFRIATNSDYQYFGTLLDTREQLNLATASQTSRLAVTAAQVAGQMALRLVHDHILRLDVQKYERVIRALVVEINRKVRLVQRLQPQLLPKALTMQWLTSASGSYGRASRSLASLIQRSDLDDVEMCRNINDRIMRVESSLLSPYVSPKDSPFRHILVGSGPHTLKGVSEHLEALGNSNPVASTDLFRNQFALATWTIQGCANSLAGDIWSLNNDI